MADNQSTREQLEKLMYDWEELHIEESKNVVVKKIKEELIKFAPDGLIGKGDEWYSLPDEKKILYICEAPNWKSENYKKNWFWLQKVVYGECYTCNSYIPDLFTQKQLSLMGEVGTTMKIDYGVLKNTAFMNLSKRGCYDGNYKRCVEKYLANDTYRDNTKEEIRILNPSIIVCYGDSARSKVDELLSEMGNSFSDIDIHVIPNQYERSK